MAREYLRGCEEGVKISLHVSPGAKSTKLRGPYGDAALRLSVAAPPERGCANAEAERFLADALNVRSSEVEVIRGASGRDKTVLVRGVSGERTGRELEGLLGG